MSHSGNRSRRAIALLVGVCTTAFVGLVAASPAQAVPPFDHSNFHPVELAVAAGGESYGAGERADFLSDKEDGLGTEAHLTVVATEDTTQVDWYFCTGPVTDPPTTPAHISTCTFIGSDPEPRQPTDPTAFAAADEAYDIVWSIPNSVDGLQRDIVSLACNGAPAAGAEPGTNCRGEVENDIWLDASDTGPNPQTTAGEFYKYDPCNAAGAGCALLGAPGGLDPANQQFDLLHGINWPNTGAAASARTSPEQGSVDFTTYGPTVDAQNPPIATTVLDALATDAAPDVTTAVYKQWSGVLDPANNAELLLALDDSDDGTFATSSLNNVGDPPADPGDECPAVDGIFCAFDAHYIVTVANALAQTHAHNDEVDNSPADPVDDPAPTVAADRTFCEDEMRNKGGDVTTDSERDEVIGCIFDQFTSFSELDSPANGELEKDTDHSMALPATWEITSANAGFAQPTIPGGTTAIEDCDGTVHDHDSDGLFEHCHYAAPDGPLNTYEAAWVAIGGGPVELVFCYDPDQGAPAAAGHGCGDATDAGKDTLTKNGEAGIDHVHVKQAQDVASDPTCLTGAGNTDAQAGSDVNLTGCVHDFFHNPTADAHVLWRINPGNDPDDPGQFVGIPEDTTDAGGHADATATSPNNAAGKTTTVRFCVDEFPGGGNGVCDSVDLVAPGLEGNFQINWTGGGQGGCIRGTQGNDRIRGTEEGDCIRGRRGNDVIRGLGGADDLNGQGDDDKLNGGPGPDDLTGGRGFDICRGGAGRDSFAGCEIIKDRQA